MKERRKRIMKRLLIEELERRALLNGTEIAMASTGLTSNSYEDVYKAVVGTEIGGPAGVGMVQAALNAPRPGQFMVLPGTVPNGPDVGFDAASGVGQMLLTTGAGTLGISSFATPTAGPSRAGGTGNAALGSPTGPIEPAAADQALSELVDELPSLATTKSDGTAQSERSARGERGVDLADQRAAEVARDVEAPGHELELAMAH